jgi:hypothetical protein
MLMAVFFPHCFLHPTGPEIAPRYASPTNLLLFTTVNPKSPLVPPFFREVFPAGPAYCSPREGKEKSAD